ncbi:MAG: hypothetical protein M1832_003096 [Thelocarpon impressellum]|nr:MAG: hypothetical protein M1832_003096 [Thelocarpon impressellum]
MLPALRRVLSHLPGRAFTTAPSLLSKPPAQFPPRLVIPESDILETFLKGSGPGGQKINKTSSAVQLKHLPSGIVVKSQATRSRSQNRKLARELLGERVEEMGVEGWSRREARAERERRKKGRRERRSRAKYRALDETRGEQGDGEGKLLEDKKREEERGKDVRREEERGKDVRREEDRGEDEMRP